MMCDPEIELQRRLERNRDGESDVSREQVQQKLIERNEQFEINILPERDKFDIELWSHEDYTIEIKRQDV